MILPTLIVMVLVLPESVGMIVAGSVSVGALFRRLLSGRLEVSGLTLRLLLLVVWIAAGLLRFEWGTTLGVLFYALSAIATMGLLLTWSDYGSYEFSAAIKAIHGVALLEAAVVLYKWARLGYPSPGDWAFGVMGGAHDAGMLFFTAMAIQGGHHLASSRVRHLLYGVFFGAMIVLTATHQALVVVCVSLGIVLLLVERRRMVLPVVAVLLFMATAPTFYFIANQVAAKGTGVPKINGYIRTYDMFVDNPLALITGVGAGNYGSRAAVARSSPDDLVKDASRIPMFLVMTPLPLKAYLADLYDAEYFSKLGNTGTYYTPFSTWNAVIGELGLVGMALFGLLWSKILGTSFVVLRGRVPDEMMPAFVTAVVGIGLAVLFAFENWLEYPKLMVPFFVTAAYTYKLYRARGVVSDSGSVPG